MGNDGPLIGFWAWPRPTSVGERRERFPDRYDSRLALVSPGKSNDVVAMGTDDLQRLVVALGENFPEFGPKFQKLPSPRKLDATVAPGLCKAAPIRRLNPRQRRTSRREIDRPPVIWIHQRQI